MARPKRLTIPHPSKQNINLRVSFLVTSEEYTGFDEFDEDEVNVEFRIRSIEEERDEEWVNVNDEWRDNVELEEVEEMLRDLYTERVKEKYVDRLTGRNI